MALTHAGFDQAKLRSSDQLPDLPQYKIWMGDGTGRPAVSDVRLPNLTHNKIWVGDITGRPIEGDLTPAAATYIVKSPDPLLPNAIALSGIASGILKIDADGNPEHAEEDVDYVSWATYNTSNTNLTTLFNGIQTGISTLTTSVDALSAVTDVLSNGITVVEVGLGALGAIVTGLIANVAALDVLVHQKAPDDAKYILQTANSDLANAQALDALSNGIPYNTGGVLSTAVPDTDYVTPFGSILTSLMYA